MKKGKKKHELSALVVTGILKSDSTLKYHQKTVLQMQQKLGRRTGAVQSIAKLSQSQFKTQYLVILFVKLF